MTLREMSKELKIGVERVRQLVGGLLTEGEDYILRENHTRQNVIVLATSGILKLRNRTIKKAGRKPKISAKFAQKQTERAERLKTDIIHEKGENND